MNKDILIKDTNKLQEFADGLQGLIAEYNEDLSVADVVYLLEETRFRIMYDFMEAQDYGTEENL